MPEQYLDLTSIFFAACCVALTLGIGLLVLRAAFTQLLRGVVPLASASIVFALGCAFFLLGRLALLSEAIGLALGSLGVYAGCALLYFAICTLLERQARKFWVLALAVAGYAGGVRYLVTGPFGLGVAILCFGAMVILGLTLRETYVSLRDRQIRGAGLLLSVLALLVLMLAWLTFSATLHWRSSEHTLLTLWLLPLIYLAATLVVIVAILQGLLMMSEQAMQALRQASLREDLLTGLPNRNALLARLDNELERCGNHGQALSLLLFEIDNFRQYNDWYGHTLGDSVLKHVGWRIQKCLPAKAHAGRWGGASFAVLLPEGGRDDAGRLTHEIIDELGAAPARIGALLVEVALCVGRATSMHSRSSRDAVLLAAEDSLSDGMHQADGMGKVREIE
ncbi:MAG: GGDEF domain-containing protein [Betaproteobacteria bacterium]|nr:GGDEF domain-containing protein [Betaproteobacteria bacterium]